MIAKKNFPYRDLLLSVLLFSISYWIYPSFYWTILASTWLLFGILFKAFRMWNHIFWTKITFVMSVIFPPIFMTLIFFLILVPVGLNYRLFRKREKASLKTNFTDSQMQIDDEFFGKLW